MSARVLAIAWDGADGTLVRRWAAEGKLPALAELIERGTSGRLGSLADHMSESIWPTIVTGCTPGTHGRYSWREVRPGSYARTRAPMRLPRPPYWELARESTAAEAARLLLVDVPYSPLVRVDGVTQVAGWGERGGARSESWPEPLLAELTDRHGPYAPNLNREVSEKPRLARVQLRTLERMVEKRTDLLLDAASRSEWELGAAVYYESHFAGHAFHQYAARADYLSEVPHRRTLEDALLRVYAAQDRALARVLAAVPADTNVVVFSGMGMRPNSNGEELLPRVLAELGYSVPRPVSASARRRDFARRVALTVLPRPVARAIRRRMVPDHAVEELAARVWLESADWSRTRAWAETEHGSAAIRVNVRGVFPSGTVEPDEYESLCDELVRDLMLLEDADTGRPAIEAVVRRDDVVPGPRAAELPDLVVKWSREVVVRRVRHPRIDGVVEEDRENWHVSEHDDDGFVVMSGPAVPAGAVVDGRVEDIAPTVLQLLGASVPAEIDGRPLVQATPA